MSFLKQLQAKKSSLKNVSTIVTYPDGRSFLENADCNIEVGKSFGFVVDSKPDNIPAKITEHIYLGSQDCCDLDVLSKFSIKCMLSVGVEPLFIPVHIDQKFVKCLDLPETNIIEILQRDCLQFINDAVDASKNVLIHCNAGISRSSAIIIGYLMLTRNLTYIEAFSTVKSKRQCIKPNAGFEKQLKTLDNH